MPHDVRPPAAVPDHSRIAFPVVTERFRVPGTAGADLGSPTGPAITPHAPAARAHEKLKLGGT